MPLYHGISLEDALKAAKDGKVEAPDNPVFDEVLLLRDDIKLAEWDAFCKRTAKSVVLAFAPPPQELEHGWPCEYKSVSLDYLREVHILVPARPDENAVRDAYAKYRVKIVVR